MQLESLHISIRGIPFTIQKPSDPLLIKSNLWATLWPSSYVLAEILALSNLAGKTVVDLGCGIGLCSVVAGIKEAIVTGLDFVPECLEVAAFNTKTSKLIHIKLEQFNWFNEVPGNLLNQFDVLLGGDILYLRSSISAVVRCIASMLNPKGFAILVDPGRPNIEDFVEQAKEFRLRCYVYQKSNHHPQIDGQSVAMERVNVLVLLREDIAEITSLLEILSDLGFIPIENYTTI